MIFAGGCRRLHLLIRKYNRKASPKTHQRGFALIVVLWGIALFSSLSIAFSAQTRSGVANARQVRDAIQDRQISLAAIYLSVEHLTTTSADPWVADSAPHEVEFDEHRLRIRLQDENGKVSLNSASQELLTNFFSWMNLNDPEMLAGRVADWRDADSNTRAQGGEGSDYAAAGLLARPRNSAFLSIDEFRSLLGITDAEFSKVCPFITAFSNSAVPDPTRAPEKLREFLLLASDTSARPSMVERTNIPADVSKPSARLMRGSGLLRNEASNSPPTYTVTVEVDAPQNTYQSIFQIERNVSRPLIRVILPPTRVYEGYCG